jgi:glycosyltransferase involved in cell wall biosynthesis
MRILHVNDVAAVASTLVHASAGRDALYQPALRRDVGDGRLATARLALRRMRDVGRMRGIFLAGWFTHLHVHYATFAYLAELAGLPFSLHLHGGDLLGDLHAPTKALLVRRGITRARRVVVSTPDLLIPARVLRTDAEYVPNPVVSPTVVPARPRREQPHIIMLSKMDYFKGWDRQVSVMEQLKRLWPNMTFSFIAQGQLPVDEQHRLSQRLRALGGTALPLLPREEFLTQIAGADIAVGQMEVGSLGISELEAMALGACTVADARAHRAIGAEPAVIDPESAGSVLTQLWGDGAARVREDWADRAKQYLRRYHDPGECLRMLETHIGTPGG